LISTKEFLQSLIEQEEAMIKDNFIRIKLTDSMKPLLNMGDNDTESKDTKLWKEICVGNERILEEIKDFAQTL
jgi:hypothetical protein